MFSTFTRSSSSSRRIPFTSCSILCICVAIVSVRRSRRAMSAFSSSLLAVASSAMAAKPFSMFVLSFSNASFVVLSIGGDYITELLVSDKKHQHDEKCEEGCGHEGEGDVAEFEYDALRAIASAGSGAWQDRGAAHLNVVLVECGESAEDRLRDGI